MELRHLRYFVSVARQQNVTRAASQLHVSQPALSRQIRDLEAAIGAQLLERSPNSVRLTSAGRLFLKEGDAILGRVDDAVDKVRAHARTEKTTIRIGYAATPAAEILKQSMQRFLKLHPKMKIELFDLSSNGIIKGVRDNKLDLGVTVSIAPQSFDGLELEELGSYEIAVAFHKKHRFTKFDRVPLSKIAVESLITFTRSDHPEAWAATCKILSPYTTDPNIVMECDGISSLVAAVEAGKGVALGFSTMAKIAGNRLTVRPVRPSSLRLPVGVIYKDQRLSDEAAEFLSVLRGVKIKTLKRSKPTLIV